MPREIKFRVWDGEKMWEPFTFADLTGWDTEDVYIKHDVQRCINEEGLVFLQFTGLYDSEGTEIYEGDTVELKDGYPRRVRWAGGGGCWMADRTDRMTLESTRLTSSFDTIFRITGNTYKTEEVAAGG